MSLSNRPIEEIINFIIANPGQAVYNEDVLASRGI